MKKKLIALAIAAAVAAPLTAQAAATLSGDAEFKMTNYGTAGLLGATQAKGWNGYNRVRVKVDADLGAGVSVHTRLRMSIGADNEVSFSTTTPAAADPKLNSTTSTNAVRTDYAYLTAKVGPASLMMGDQLATWGTKVFIEGSTKMNRLKATFKPSGTLTAGITMDPYADAGEGKPQIGFFAIAKVSNMMTAGVLVIGKKDPATDAENNIFVKGQMAGVTYGVESMTQNNTTDERANYIMAGMKAGGANLALHIITNKKADADWSPVGVINGQSDLIAAQTDITVITAGLKAGGMDVTVGVGQAGDGTNQESLMGVDLGKKLGAANFVFSYGSHNSESAYGFKFNTKF